MSQPVQSEQVTRLLIQKRGDYAELEEMARIAVTVLHDDGWLIQRLESELQVTANFSVTAKPVMQPGLASALADAELKYAALRGEVERLLAADRERFAQNEALTAKIIHIRRRHWLAAAAGCFLCSLLATLHAPALTWTPMSAVCILVYRFYGYRRAKGAK